MVYARKTEIAVPDKVYPDLGGLARRVTELISAPKVSPADLRQVYEEYITILAEAGTQAQRLYNRARAEFSSRLQDLIELRRILETPIEHPSIQGHRVAEHTSQIALRHPPDETVETRVSTYEGQIDPNILGKVKQLIGQYVDGPTICKIAGYGKQGLYGRVRNGNVPAQGKTSGRKYLVNEYTIPILFGKYSRASASEVPEKVRTDESVDDVVAKYEKQIGPKKMDRLRGLMGTYVDAATICGIVGYDTKTLRERVKENGVPTQGRTRSTRYLIDKSTVPLLFREKNANDVQPDNPKMSGNEEGVWMNQRRIQKEFGYFNKGEVYQILKEHPEINRKVAAKRGVKATAYLITPENRRFFDRAGSSGLEQIDSSSLTGRISTTLAAMTGGIPDATGEFLTFEQMLDYARKRVGDTGEAKVVELFMKGHGDDIQEGHDRFSKARLDELLEAPTQRV